MNPYSGVSQTDSDEKSISMDFSHYPHASAICYNQHLKDKPNERGKTYEGFPLFSLRRAWRLYFRQLCAQKRGRGDTPVKPHEPGGFRIWYDDGIAPGSEWPEYIAHHLNDAAVCMALVSPDSIASANCKIIDVASKYLNHIGACILLICFSRFSLISLYDLSINICNFSYIASSCVCGYNDLSKGVRLPTISLLYFLKSSVLIPGLNGT